MDLLPFQAGSYASDEEETKYLENDLDGNLVSGVKFELPEVDDDITETTDDRPGEAHSTYEAYTACLVNQQDSTVRVREPESTETRPQAAIDTSEDTRIVKIAPDIEFDFGDEPIIEISRYY